MPAVARRPRVRPPLPDGVEVVPPPHPAPLGRVEVGEDAVEVVVGRGRTLTLGRGVRAREKMTVRALGTYALERRRVVVGVDEVAQQAEVDGVAAAVEVAVEAAVEVAVEAAAITAALTTTGYRTVPTGETCSTQNTMRDN